MRNLFATLLIATLTLSACNTAEELTQEQHNDTGPTTEELESSESEPAEEEPGDEVSDLSEEANAEFASTSYLEDEPEYVEFSQARHEELKGNKPFVVFFHADWCPTCIALEKNVKPALSTFPKGTKILEANFDKEVALKQEYGVNVQSTLVVVDANGKAVQTLAAPGNSELITAIENSL